VRLCAILLLTAVCLGAEAPAPGLDLTGAWSGIIAKRGRIESTDIAFQFIQQGEVLTGKLYGDGPGSPILDGRVDELGNVRFRVETREQAGNQINDVIYLFDGVLCDGVFEMTQERAFARDAVSGAIIPVRRPDDTPQQDHGRRFKSFVLERLY
jgi:hypothetical protein